MSEVVAKPILEAGLLSLRSCRGKKIDTVLTSKAHSASIFSPQLLYRFAVIVCLFTDAFGRYT